MAHIHMTRSQFHHDDVMLSYLDTGGATRDKRFKTLLCAVAQGLEEQDLARSRESGRKAAAEFQAYFAKTDAHLTPAARVLTDEDVVLLVKGAR